MFEQNQYDAWAVELANYFVSKKDYHMVRMSKDRREFWLVNQNAEVSPILMISAYPSDAINQPTISHDRLALSSVFHVSDKGLNISVNQESIMSDESTVILGPGIMSVSEQLASFKGIEFILRPSNNPNKALMSAFRSIQKTAVKTQQKLRRRANPVTTVVSGITLIIFAIGMYLRLEGASDVSSALMLGAYYKPLIVKGGEYFRLLTAGFVHVDVFHLLINIMAFRNLGTMIEPVLGKKRYLFVLIAGILFGNMFVFIVDDGAVGLGISGGLFALLGVLLVYLFETQAIRNPRIRNQVISTLIMNLMISMLPNVSMMAHLGGLQVGIFLGIIFSKRIDWVDIRKGAQFMLIIFSAFLVILMVMNQYSDPNLQSLALYAQTWKHFGFDWYAKRIVRLFF